MTRETGLEFKLAGGLDFKADGEGKIEGYASLFGVEDLGGDIVEPGAFAGALARKAAAGESVKMLWQHDPYDPIGVWHDLAEDDKGLRVRGRLLTKVQRGREALEMVAAKAIDGLSIGYRTLRGEGRAEGGRVLKELDLWEISLVTFPMLPTARIDAAKAAEMDKSEFERRLTQDAGLSRSVARALLRGGLSAVKQTDADVEGMADLIACMRTHYTD
jgi:HK97 family phage prohead protease